MELVVCRPYQLLLMALQRGDVYQGQMYNILEVRFSARVLHCQCVRTPASVMCLTHTVSTKSMRDSYEKQSTCILRSAPGLEGPTVRSEVIGDCQRGV